MHDALVCSCYVHVNALDLSQVSEQMDLVLKIPIRGQSTPPEPLTFTEDLYCVPEIPKSWTICIDYWILVSVSRNHFDRIGEWSLRMRMDLLCNLAVNSLSEIIRE